MLYPEQLIEMGINAPKEHQRIISKLTTGLGILFYKEKSIALEPLPETMIDEGQTSPVPDIQLYDNEHFTTPIIIEVAHANGVRNDFKKVARLMEEFDYGVQEGFVYDYIKKEWWKYRKGEGRILENSSFSEVLNLDLAGLL
jgi:Uma2 family endonuclease